MKKLFSIIVLIILVSSCVFAGGSKETTKTDDTYTSTEATTSTDAAAASSSTAATVPVLPDGTTPPQMPEGMTPPEMPEGMAMPEGMTPPDMTGEMTGDQFMDTSNLTVTDTSVVLASTIDEADQFSKKDSNTDYTESECTVIDLSNITAGSYVITKEGSYILRGSYNGQVVVNTTNDTKVQLILDNVQITSASSAAIYIKQADKVFLTLAPGSQNTLTSAGKFVAIDEEDIDGAIFAKDDLTINGSGTLTINSPYGQGITANDELIITGGNINITAKNHGFDVNDNICISGGTFTIESGKDAFHCSNDDTTLGYIYITGGKFNFTTEGDGLDASGEILITGGDFEIVSGGGSANTTNSQSIEQDFRGWVQGTTTTEEDTASTKGIKADILLVIKGGTFSLDCCDDALHTNKDILITGGTFEISTGDDGIHADGQLQIDNGTISIAKSYEGLEGEVIVINGGSVNLIASDDGLNAAGGDSTTTTTTTGRGGWGMSPFDSSSNCLILIKGGKLIVNAAGDGIDSNGSLLITGGQTIVYGPTNSGNGALDYAISSQITGGSFIAFGMSGMAQSLGSTSTQGVIYTTTNSYISADSQMVLSDESGKTIIEATSPKQYNSVVISAPSIASGSTYTLKLGTQTQTIQMTSLIYGSSSGMMGGFGMGGGMGGDRGNKQMNQGGFQRP